MKKYTQATLSLKPETRNKLNKLKYEYNFSSVDSLINALINNTKILKEVLKNETKIN